MLTTTGSDTGVITSPNYPNNYNNDDSVCWIISQPAGYTISLSFDSFYTQPIMDFVDVHDGSSTSSLLLLSASGFTLPRNVTSKSNEMIIVFLSDGSKVFRGFKAKFTASHVVDDRNPSSSPQIHLDGCLILAVACPLVSIFRTIKS